MTRSSPAQHEWLVPGVVAGLVSGVLLVAFAAYAEYRAGLPASTTYTFLTSVALGNALGESPAAVATGVVVLFVNTIVWACAYVYAARKQAQLLTRPVLSGAGFGITVWLVLQAVLLAANHFTSPTLYSFSRDMVGFIAFFGVPIAVTASRVLQAK